MARTIIVLAALAFVAYQAPAPDPIRPDPDSPRPIPARYRLHGGHDLDGDPRRHEGRQGHGDRRDRRH